MIGQYLRIFKYDGSSFTDFTLENSDASTSFDMTLNSSSYIYIGQEFAFNNFFVQFEQANTNDANINIEYWSGSQWRSVVDTLDGSKDAAISFGKDGVVQFEPNHDYSWQRIVDTSDASAPSEMQTLTHYNLNWLRVSFSENLSTTTIKRIAYKFADTVAVNSHDVEIQNYYSRFGDNKTNWDNEIVTASRYVVRDLKRMGAIDHYGQLLRFETIGLATELKTLEFIYQNLGKSYDSKREMVKTDYQKTLKIDKKPIDKDNNAATSFDETRTRYQRVFR